jgi:hypothetical protein
VTTAPAPQQLDATGSVVLDADGYGTVTLAPESFRTWTVTAINVRTNQATTATPVPQVTVYRGGVGGQIIAQTWMGNRATASGSDEFIQPSQPLVTEWTNGIPGTTASVWLSGTMDMR